jgi:hypothetical protein
VRKVCSTSSPARLSLIRRTWLSACWRAPQMASAAIARTMAISRPASGASPRLWGGSRVTSDIDGCDGSNMSGDGSASCGARSGACADGSVPAGALPGRFTRD